MFCEWSPTQSQKNGSGRVSKDMEIWINGLIVNLQTILENNRPATKRLGLHHHPHYPLWHFYDILYFSKDFGIYYLIMCSMFLLSIFH